MTARHRALRLIRTGKASDPISLTDSMWFRAARHSHLCGLESADIVGSSRLCSQSATPKSVISETGKGGRSKRPPLSETSLQVPMPVVSPFVGFALPFFAIALILLTEKGVSVLRVRNSRNLRCIVL